MPMKKKGVKKIEKKISKIDVIFKEIKPLKKDSKKGLKIEREIFGFGSPI
tara:strand:- start:2740 stop:2889 length:150 start_codon:yes stop_codon:yes gene_type:complete